MAHCSGCGVPVPVERVELLGVDTCKSCTVQPEKVLGFFEYGSAEEGPHAGGEGVLRLLKPRLRKKDEQRC